MGGPSIRLAEERDAEAIAKIYGPACDSTPISFEVAAPSAQEMASRIRATVDRFPWLVLDRAGVRGYAYAAPHRPRAAYGWAVEAAVYVSPMSRREGVGRALYTALFDLLRLQGYFKAYAGITLPNAASIALHERVGFRQVGIYRGVGFKHGAWHDVSWYQLVLQPEHATPALPLPVRELMGVPGWHDAIVRGLQHYSGPSSADTA